MDYKDIFENIIRYTKLIKTCDSMDYQRLLRIKELAEYGLSKVTKENSKNNIKIDISIK